MAPMGVSPPIGLTNHGGVEPLGLLCVECYSFAMFKGTEVVRYILIPLGTWLLGVGRAAAGTWIRHPCLPWGLRNFDPTNQLDAAPLMPGSVMLMA